MSNKLKALEQAIFAKRKKGRIKGIRRAYQEWQAEKRWGWLKRFLIGKEQ